MTALAREHSIGRSIYGAGQIADAVERLAGEIAADYRGQPLVLLGVLKGALCFIGDLSRRLARKLDGPSLLRVDYLCVQRYGAQRHAGPAQLTMDAATPLSGTHVVVVDGIVDNGRTLDFVRALLERRGAASLRNCVLFDKPARREANVRIDYRGLAVPNLFAIGYGLDYQEHYRNLPYLAELREGRTV